MEIFGWTPVLDLDRQALELLAEHGVDLSAVDETATVRDVCLKNRVSYAQFKADLKSLQADLQLMAAVRRVVG